MSLSKARCLTQWPGLLHVLLGKPRLCDTESSRAVSPVAPCLSLTLRLTEGWAQPRFSASGGPGTRRHWFLDCTRLNPSCQCLIMSLMEAWQQRLFTLPCNTKRMKHELNTGRQEDGSRMSLPHSGAALNLVVSFQTAKAKKETKAVKHRHTCKRPSPWFLL